MSLEIKNLTFSYKARRGQKPVKVLDNFSASFEFGRITALIGDNGSGKTTLAKLIMGIMCSDSGSHCTFLDGESIDDWSLAQRGRAIGYVMQNPAKQIFNETVLEEVMYGLLNQGLSSEDAKNVALGYIEMFGLSHHEQDFPFNLSHGEKQRLVLASILAMKPGYLILDEPTASLDRKHRQLLGELILQIARPEERTFAGIDGDTDERQHENCPGCGVIVISHDKNFIEEYCDEEVCLNA